MLDRGRREHAGEMLGIGFTQNLHVRNMATNIPTAGTQWTICYGDAHYLRTTAWR